MMVNYYQGTDMYVGTVNSLIVRKDTWKIGFIGGYDMMSESR